MPPTTVDEIFPPSDTSTNVTVAQTCRTNSPSQKANHPPWPLTERHRRQGSPTCCPNSLSGGENYLPLPLNRAPTHHPVRSSPCLQVPVCRHQTSWPFH
ncbi:hypothetical protein T484DRAFT_1966431 [Baffinella frigidus]|nr:hypothetical protein T484DRAFT_1966431 [Cryptophyta sp. CCMP2293]